MAVARPRRRPLTREEIQARQEEKRLRRAKEREAWELSRGPIDLPFGLLVVLLTAIGLVMLLSASFPSAYYEYGNPTFFFSRQAEFAVIGVIAMYTVSKINYERFRGAAEPLLFLSIILLVLVAIPGIGLVRNNARRWLGIPGIQSFQFQPSEVAKMAVVLYFADTISKKKDKMRTVRYGIAPYFLILLVISGLMMLEPHLSGTVLILTAGAVLLLVGGIEMKWVGIAAAGAGGIGYLMMTGIIQYGQSRISMWQNPWQDARGKGYQLVQSLVSVGSGGLFGVGLGRSSQKFQYLPEEHNDFIFAIICEELGLIGAAIIMLLFAALVLRGYWIALHARNRFGSLLVVGLGRSSQKFQYLPEEHNDFIFAIICEELGLIGAAIIMLLFAALILRGYWIALHARNRFGSLLVVGITTLLAMQTFLNIGVVTGLLPTTGISLPFFSYGGTALCMQLAEMGVVLSVSRQMKPTKAG